MRRATWALLGAVALCCGCGGGSDRHYYTLTYPHDGVRFAEALPYTVRVKDVEVRDTYRGTELVHRADIHEIRYYKTKRWSERPRKMLTDLLRDHMQSAGLFRSVTADIGQTPPDFTLAAEVEALEEVATPEGRYARLAMNLKLIRFADDTVVWNLRFDRRRPVGGDSVRTTVRVLSAMLSRELDRALGALSKFLVDGEAPPKLQPEEPAEQAPAVEDALVRPSITSKLNDLPQFLADPTPVPVGFGAIFVPQMINGENEPLVAVYRNELVVAEGYPGRRLVVRPGQYVVRFGSGAISQQVEAQVVVEEARTTIVPPTWGGLQIDVVDPQFVPFRGNYELIRMDNREDYGIGFGADELLGEALKTWILPPGLYKIIRAGGTYRDRTDFATVRLSPGELTRFTLVLDPSTGEFEGAGEVDPAEAAEALTSAWSLRGIIGGDVQFTFTDDQIDAPNGSTLGLRAFFDASLTYNDEKHQWVSRLDLEEGQRYDPTIEEFVNDDDRLFLHTIYTYRLVPWFGPYGRIGLETKLLPDIRQPGPDREVGTEDDGTGGDVTLRDSFEPLEILTGVGGNFRLLRMRAIEADLRLGFGARQTFQDGVLDFDLEPLEDVQRFGPESTLLIQARLSRWIAISSEFDGLMPVDNVENTEFSFRNSVSLRLTSFASLTYRYIALRTPRSNRDTQTSQEHDLQLRFSYTLF